jgi:formate dehydrogenase major subunit
MDAVLPDLSSAQRLEHFQHLQYGAENNAKVRVKALVTDRVARGVAFMPFHFAGWYQGEDMRRRYPNNTDPIVLGESLNTVTNYGYDPVTNMHEGKVTLCRIQAA